VRQWFQMPVAAHLLLRRDAEILLLRRDGTGYEDGKYSVVAGHLDGAEPASAAMIREAREEAGIVIRPEDLAFALVMHRKAPDQERIDFFYECRSWEGDVRNMEPEKCDALHFVPADTLPENTIPYVKAAIAAAQAGIKYVEFGW